MKAVARYFLIVSVFVGGISTAHISKEAWETSDEAEQRAFQDAFEIGGFYDGDMMLHKGQKQPLGVGRNVLVRRSDSLGVAEKWPKSWSGEVIIPYEFATGYQGHNEEEKKRIQLAMRAINDLTCVKFAPRKNEEDYLFIRNEKGCSSHLGKQGGKQSIIFEEYLCTQKQGPVQHELLHALGFRHTHTRPDRDQFVRINWENLNQDFNYSWRPDSKRYHDTFDTPYDYMSVMHYGPNAGSINYKDTITTIDPTFQTKIGIFNSLSPGDVERINKMYECSGISWRTKFTAVIGSVGLAIGLASG